MTRRLVIDVPAEWLRPRKGNGRQLKRAKARVRTLRTTLGDADFRRVLAGKLTTVADGQAK